MIPDDVIRFPAAFAANPEPSPHWCDVLTVFRDRPGSFVRRDAARGVIEVVDGATVLGSGPTAVEAYRVAGLRVWGEAVRPRPDGVLSFGVSMVIWEYFNE